MTAWWKRQETAFRNQESHEEGRIVARQAGARFSTRLDTHRIALQQMANYFANSEEVTAEEFSSFARTTQDLTSLFLRIQVVDASWRVGWGYPVERTNDLLGSNLQENGGEISELVRRVRETQSVSLSPAMALPDGSRGFLLAVPIARDGTFKGAVVGTFRTADFFGGAVLSDLHDRYYIEVLGGVHALYSSAATPRQELDSEVIRESFTAAGTLWQVVLWPKKQSVRSPLHAQGVFWAMAGLMSLLLGAACGGAAYWGSGLLRRVRTQEQTLQKCRHRLDGATRQLLEAERMTAVGELVAGVAHELNNPLTGILGYAQLLQREVLPSSAEKRVEFLISEATRAAKIVRNLLTFARKRPPEKRYVGLNGLIKKTLELKSYHLRANQIEVLTDLDPDLPKTMLDFHQVQQVLINLIVNAEQALSEAGGGGQIRIATRHAGGRIQVRVSDSGPGVPLEIRSRIFEPFFTTKEEGKGTGLGLSLCYGIVREHGGTITVNGLPGQGASFLIDLPVRTEESAAEPGDETAAPKLNVLVVDDDESVLGYWVDVLAPRGIRVDTAAGMTEALGKIAAEHHDLIISDLRVQQERGETLYQEVERRDPDRARRIIFTADGSDLDAERVVRDRGNPLLVKPYTLPQIDRAIEDALEN
jgi:signal transduction histidine kinase